MTEIMPSIPPYGRQLFICTNGNCASAETVTALLQQLGHLHRKHGMHRFSNPQRITHVPCGCLGVCINGPILVVYPDGIWYGQVDRERLDRIYQEHFLEGNPVEEYIFHRYFAPGQEPSTVANRAEAHPADPLQLAAEAAAAEKERQAAGQELLPDHVRLARERRQRRQQRRPAPANPDAAGPQGSPTETGDLDDSL
jgi:(2Fe-2S) ferredoxin